MESLRGYIKRKAASSQDRWLASYTSSYHTAISSQLKMLMKTKSLKAKSEQASYYPAAQSEQDLRQRNLEGLE
jgi:hypothetical protein